MLCLWISIFVFTYICSSSPLEISGSTNVQIESTKNIIIFGGTGVGKTSVINMLTESSVLDSGWKDPSPPLSYEIITKDETDYYDTNGISEKKLNLFDGLESIHSLQKLINIISNQGPGINLLILVMKRGRITNKMEQNYHLFVNLLTQKQVPVLLVITHVEEDSPLDSWWNENQESFYNYDFLFKETISVCANRGEGLHAIFTKKLEDCYLTSQEKLIGAVEQNILDMPWKAKEINDITSAATEHILNAGEMSTIQKYGLDIIELKTYISDFFVKKYELGLKEFFPEIIDFFVKKIDLFLGPYVIMLI